MSQGLHIAQSTSSRSVSDDDASLLVPPPFSSPPRRKEPPATGAPVIVVQQQGVSTSSTTIISSGIKTKNSTSLASTPPAFHYQVLEREKIYIPTIPKQQQQRKAFFYSFRILSFCCILILCILFDITYNEVILKEVLLNTTNIMRTNYDEQDDGGLVENIMKTDGNNSKSNGDGTKNNSNFVRVEEGKQNDKDSTPPINKINKEVWNTSETSVPQVNWHHDTRAHTSGNQTTVITSATDSNIRNGKNATKQVVVELEELAHGNPIVGNGSQIESEKRKETFLFIHAGPVKTGSSSIQCSLQSNHLLEQNKFYYLGRRERQCADDRHKKLVRRKFFNVQSFVFQYLARGWLKQESSQSFVESFINGMKQRHDKGVHTIISGEEFCKLMFLGDELFQLFANLLNDLDQTIRFQVVYRDFFEWAHSVYSFLEMWKFPMHEFQGRSMSSIVDEKVQPHFIGNADKTCSPFGLWSFLNSTLPFFTKKVHVDILNIHATQKGDLGTEYLCSLPNATVVCEASRKAFPSVGKSRPTDLDLLHSDRIASAAWEKGLFQNSSAVQTRRIEVDQAIKDHVYNELKLTFTDLPLECLQDDILAHLLNQSIQYGTTMLGNQFDESILKKKFDLFVTSNKFCSVNVTAIVTDPHWIAFFQNISLFG